MDNTKSRTSEGLVPLLPHRVEVKRLLSSRYAAMGRVVRPESWDERHEGGDIIEIADGTRLLLKSSAMQSPPKPGWILMLTAGDARGGYVWTLYGIRRSR